VAGTAITAGAGFLANSSIILFFFTLVLHTMGTVTFIFMILPLCPSSKTADLFPLLAMLAPGIGLYMTNVASGFPSGLFWPSCLISTAAAPLGVALFIQAEMDGIGLKSVTQGEHPLLGVWLFQLFDIALYAALAWYLGQVIPAPTTAGDRKPWNFCLPRCLKGESEPMGDDSVANDRASGLASESVDGVPVRVSHLKKVYQASPAPVHALVDLSFDMQANEVTGLLGQNGAGKTSAINVLCGLVKPSGGQAYVHGYDVRHDIDRIRQISGICPQHDLLFDELTVRQHIDLYAGIKGLDRANAHEQVRVWLERLEMKHKADTKAEALSGGQRRKVSLIVALLGTPKFVLLDEPTAGMDPQSRRAVWDFVLASKAGRATLLTTHFMDEADALCGRIVVVSKGVVAAIGSPSDLKAQYAAGYHLVAALKRDDASSGESAESAGVPAGKGSDRLLAVAQKHVPHAKLESASAEQASITLPSESSAAFPALFSELDASSADLDVTSYGISLPSMQEAFLQILDTQKGAGGYLEGSNRARNTSDGPLPTDELLVEERSDHQAPTYRRASLGQQLALVGLKLKMELLADPWLSGVPIVVIALLAVLAFLLGPLVTPSAKSGSDPSAPEAITLSPAPFASQWPGFPMPYLPPEGSFASELGAGSRLQVAFEYTPAPSFAAVDPADASGPHRALSDNLTLDEGAFAAFAMPNGSAATAATILYNSSYPNLLSAFTPLFEQALLNVTAPGLTVTPQMARLPYEDTSESEREASAALTLSIAPLIMIFAMLLIVNASSKRIADERFNATKQLLLLSGLDVRIFWAGYFLYDISSFLVLLVGIGAIAAAAVGAVGAGLPALILCELCALPGIAFMGYLITLPFKNYDEAAGFIMMVFMFFGLLPTVLVSFVTDNTTRLIFNVILLLAPPNQIITGLIAVLTLERISARQQDYDGAALGVGAFFKITYEDQVYNMQTLELESKTYLGPGLTMIVALCSSLALGALFYRIEIRRYTVPRAVPRALPAEEITGDAEAEDEDVSAERRRVAGLAPTSREAGIRVEGLTKDFHTSKNPLVQLLYTLFPSVEWGGPKLRAVHNLTFAVPGGTCFALLGPNGAGKTSAINVLTGEVTATAGEASLNGLSTSSRLMDVFECTGFCPQLKGVWESLTLRQHLTIILRLKGYHGAELDAAIRTVEEGYGLTAHAHKKAKKLSGGTQRKLSAAMALSCGAPKVVFVDEPTTGVDVGTRRFIWDRIQEAARQRIVVLTTHYMDEADVLAQRIGIMAAGRMRVIGSPQHLKTRHGGGYRIELKSSADADAALATEALTKLVEEHFKQAKPVHSRQGTLVFEVGQDFALAKVFAAFEEAKTTLGLETFTMSQTSLEDVFLRVAEANKADVAEQVRGTPGGAPGGGLETQAANNSLVKQGYYTEAWGSVWLKVTPATTTPEMGTSSKPTYHAQNRCCLLALAVPIPCCCCPTETMTLQADEAEAGIEVYHNGREGWRSTKHTWKEEGKFNQKSDLGDDNFRRCF